MKINFYFEWCSNCHPDDHPYELNYGRWAMSDLWFKVYRKLKIKYNVIKFQAYNNAFIWSNPDKYKKMTNGGKYLSGNGKFGVNSVVIENPINKKFIVCTSMDYIEDLYHNTNNWDMENCVQIITSMGAAVKINHYAEFKRADINFTPSVGSYMDHPDQENWINQIYLEKKDRIFSEKPRFIGYLYGTRIDLKNTNKLEILDKHQAGKNTNIEYLKELSKYKINLSLNSVAEISGRDFEIFGLGSVNLRCVLNCSQFHNPLIPDYHYAAINIFNHEDPNKIADAFLEKYEYLKSNPDFIEFLSENGRKWYEQNVPRENGASILVNEIIQINKLI